MADRVRNGIRSFLQITPPQQQVLQITEQIDYYGNAAINRIWERGDGSELSQLYKALPGEINKIRFWAAVPSVGNDINKLHTGLPKIICRILTDIVMSDMNDITVEGKYQGIWEIIAKDNDFEDLLESAIKNILIVGDGAFKVAIDPKLTEYPIIEFVPGDNLEYVYERGRLKKIIFRSNYPKREGIYVLEETYGRGYIRTELLRNGKKVPLDSIEDTAALNEEITFDGNFMMAQQFMAFKSDKYKGHGSGIFDGKADSFDSLDEVWSQWMDALRRGRSKEYIPETMVPRNPKTGEVMAPNAFDHAYIKVDKPAAEGATSEIDVKQPSIPHESYLSTYMTALDLCLQGILSPSTLGIDVKKMDNAEAQREKEKVTLYTRNKLVQAIQKTIPLLVDMVLKVRNTQLKLPLEDVVVDISFGEYANPSFESQIETVGKGKTQGIMSIEACVDELYGDSKDDEWKEQEIARLKAEQGIAEVTEPAVNMEGLNTEEKSLNLLNGAQIGSLMNIIKMVKEGSVARSEAISIVTATLGISRENAESFIEEGMSTDGTQEVPAL